MEPFKRLLWAAVLALAGAGAVAADYANPILHADYSDPDVIRVGKTYYMTSSSFNSAPGLPLLQSRDMVHWALVGHALPQLVPAQQFARPQHGKGVWAPALRHHGGKFWIFYPDPDQGVYVVSATDFAGPWSAPRLLLAGKGIIDPAPLWDDDGSAWLMHAWAKSRAGINNVITLRRMAPDAASLLDEQGKVVIDGATVPNVHTLEGPKLYQYGGYYYVFAPAGGVETGWQSVFRARSVDGPYEHRIVMVQGESTTNGPHQGAWVRNEDGSDWFYHFQDKGAYGRVVHLQPMRWRDGWPLVGAARGGAPFGEPVQRHRQPLAGPMDAVAPPTSDDFAAPALGLQWQWNANWKADWYSLTARPGFLRLYSQLEGEAQDNLWNRSAILLQKLPAERFTVTARLDASALAEGDSAGLVMYGTDYAWLGVRRARDGLRLVMVNCLGTLAGCKENTVFSAPLAQPAVSLRMKVGAGGQAVLLYSVDGKSFSMLPAGFRASVGRWVGARIGLFSAAGAAAGGYADVDSFHVTVQR